MMAKNSVKLLDVKQVLVDFGNKPLKFMEMDGQKLEDRPDTTLKHILLRLLSSAHNSAASLSDEEKVHAYEAGRIIGTHIKPGLVELQQKQYDVIKKLLDNGKLKIQNQEIDVLTLIERQQAKQMIDRAKNG